MYYFDVFATLFTMNIHYSCRVRHMKYLRKSCPRHNPQRYVKCVKFRDSGMLLWEINKSSIHKKTFLIFLKLKINITAKNIFS